MFLHFNNLLSVHYCTKPCVYMPSFSSGYFEQLIMCRKDSIISQSPTQPLTQSAHLMGQEVHLPLTYNCPTQNYPRHTSSNEHLPLTNTIAIYAHFQHVSLQCILHKKSAADRQSRV